MKTKKILISALLLSLLGVGFITSCNKDEPKEEPGQQQTENDKNPDQKPDNNDDSNKGENDSSNGGPSLDI